MPFTREDVQDIIAELKRSGATTFTELNSNVADLKNRVVAVERHSSNNGSGFHMVTAKDLLLDCKELQNRPKELMPGMGVRFELSRKATLTGVSSQVFSGPPAVAGLPILPTPVRALLTIIPTSSGAIQVIRKTAFTGAAAPVAEGALKPEATATVTVTPVPVEKIAVWMKVSKETYEDLPALVGEIESELLGDVNLAEEGQLLKGTGVSPQLAGLFTNAPAMTSLPVGTSYVDQIAAGLGKLVSLGYTPNGVVVNGADWQAAKISKTATSGEYLFGSPAQAVADRLWGLPVVVSSKLASPEWLAGDFRRAATLYERESVGFSVAMMNEDDFKKNLVCILAELREVLVIKQAAALIRNGTLAAGLSAPEPEIARAEPEATGKKR